MLATINEARELAEADMGVRMRELATGPTPACPEMYVVERAVTGVPTASPSGSNRSESTASSGPRGGAR
jgi:hypothetical protein